MQAKRIIYRCPLRKLLFCFVFFQKYSLHTYRYTRRYIRSLNRCNVPTSLQYELTANLSFYSCSVNSIELNLVLLMNRVQQSLVESRRLVDYIAFHSHSSEYVQFALKLLCFVFVFGFYFSLFVNNFYYALVLCNNLEFQAGRAPPTKPNLQTEWSEQSIYRQFLRAVKSDHFALVERWFCAKSIENLGM